MRNISYKTKKRLANFMRYVFLGIVSLISVFPFYWILTGATNTRSDIISGKLTPGLEFMGNLETLLANTDIMQAFLNTAQITIAATLTSLFVSALAGYGFAKFNFKGKERVYALLLFSMMIPFAATMIPLFQLTAQVGLIDNKLAIILPATASVFLIFFFRQNFVSVPSEIIEAARIDGAKEFTIFFRVVAPSMKSTFAAAGIWAFMSQWNSFLWPLIVLQSEGQKTLTLVLSSMSSAYYIEYGALMLAILIATIPVLVVFLSMQKHFVEGMVGSNK
ncbi:MAG: carbohydrate ABC transporter permease [Culicoidibacterales bacterium]